MKARGPAGSGSGCARLRACAAALAAGALLPAGPAVSAPSTDRQPSPYALLGSTTLRPPAMDPIGPCAAVASDPAVLDPVRSRTGTLPPAPRSPECSASTAARLASPVRDDGEAPLGATPADPEILPEAACAEIEIARAELAAGRLQDAAAAAVRAARSAGAPGALLDQAGFYRAEALYLGRWSTEARAMYEVLACSQDARIAAAASLRLADLRFDASPADARDAYAAAVASAEASGLAVGRWAPRQAEAALAAGDAAAARGFLERALREAPSKTIGGELRLRLADVWASEGQVAKALAVLTAVERDLGDAPAGTLARIRSLELRPEAAAREAAQAFLRQAGRDFEHPYGVAANALLARALAASGAVEEALEVAARIARAPVASGLESRVSDGIDAVLAEARARHGDGDAGCRTLVRWLGGRVTVLAARARTPDAFLELGACYAQLGVAASALDVYRTVSRVFGGHGSEDFTLLVAETAFAAGDTLTARRIVESHPPQGPLPASWQLLLAEVDLAEGRSEAALRSLVELVRSRESDALRVRAVRALARSVPRFRDGGVDREEIDAAVEAFAAARPADAGAVLGEAALAVAQLHRLAGDATRSQARYALAFDELPPGPLRAEAGYWLAELTAESVSREAVLREVTATGAGAWSRLAAMTLEIGRIRTELEGAKEATPEARP